MRWRWWPELGTDLLDNPDAQSHRTNKQKEVHGKPERPHMRELACAGHMEVEEGADDRQCKKRGEKTHDDRRVDRGKKQPSEI